MHIMNIIASLAITNVVSLFVNEWFVLDNVDNEGIFKTIKKSLILKVQVPSENQQGTYMNHEIKADKIKPGNS